jgi:molybdopterin molybdotransferase
MTGAPLPAGADAVVMVEYTERQGNVVTLHRTTTRGENFVPVGAEARAGQVLLAPGTRMNHAAIAVAASTGQAEVQVHTRPRVAILATGDELVAVDARPGPAQIRNSNSYSLAAQVTAAGGTPEILPTAPDNETALCELITRGLQSDLLLVAGGVSMGRFDLVEQVLGDVGAEFIFTGALIQPGRPVVFGHVPSCARLFFGLPGNPVSTMVTFELFVRPVLDALCGTSPRPLQFLQAHLKSEFRTKPGLTRFLPAVLIGQSEHSEVELVRWHGSGDIAATAAANCYVVIPPERESIAAGEDVAVLLQNVWF